MDWIEHEYRLLWTKLPPERREYDNAPTAWEHRDFVSGAGNLMMTAGVVTVPEGEKPWVVSPLGVAPKKGTDKFRRTGNMRYALCVMSIGGEEVQDGRSEGHPS